MLDSLFSLFRLIHRTWPEHRSSIGSGLRPLYPFLRVGSQILALVVICAIGQFAVQELNLPMPGFVAGMALLFALLITRAVQLRWIEEGASILLRHLSFFFIPIAVGLMAFGALFWEHGIAIVATLLTSAAVGIVVAAVVTQALSRNDRQP